MQVYSEFFTSGLSNISGCYKSSKQSSHSSTSSHDMSSAVSDMKSSRRHAVMTHIQNVHNLPTPTLSTNKDDFDNTTRCRYTSSSLPSPSKKGFSNISHHTSVRLDSEESPLNYDEAVENGYNVYQDPQAEALDSTSFFNDELGNHDETWAQHKHGTCVPITQLSMRPLSHSALRYFESRERPGSIQTSPSPLLASRRSSFQQWSDSSDSRMWLEDGLLSPPLRLEKEDPVDVDWREFHDSLLYNADKIEGDR